MVWSRPASKGDWMLPVFKTQSNDNQLRKIRKGLE
jgi:hypothetical protein